MYVLVCGRIKKGVLFFDSIWQKQKKLNKKQTNKQMPNLAKISVKNVNSTYRKH